MGVTNPYIWGLISYVWMLQILTFGDFIHYFWVFLNAFVCGFDFIRLGVTISYVLGFDLLCLGATNPYIWGLDFLR